MICAVGSEQRDYPTLLTAVRDLPLAAELAVSRVGLEKDDGVDAAVRELHRGTPPGTCA